MFEREQEIKIESQTYYIIDVIKNEGEEYLYVQELIDDEPIESYKIYKYDEESNGMIQVKDEEKARKLLKMFIENIQKDLGEE